MFNISSGNALLNALKGLNTYRTVYGYPNPDDGYSEVLLVEYLARDTFGYEISIDINGIGAWGRSIRKSDRRTPVPCRYIDMGFNWMERERTIRNKMDCVFQWLGQLGVNRIDIVAPDVCVGDLVNTKTKANEVNYVAKPWTMVVRRIDRVNTPYDPCGYTYVAVCSRYRVPDLAEMADGGLGDQNIDISQLIFCADGKHFRGVKHNHRALDVIGTEVGGVYAISDSSSY